MPASPILPGGFLLGCGFLKRRYRHRGCWDDLRPHVDTTENPPMAIFQLTRQTNRDKIASSLELFFLNQVSFPGNNCFLFFFSGVFQGLWRKMKMLFKEIVLFLFFGTFCFSRFWTDFWIKNMFPSPQNTRWDGISIAQINVAFVSLLMECKCPRIPIFLWRRTKHNSHCSGVGVRFLQVKSWRKNKVYGIQIKQTWKLCDSLPAKSPFPTCFFVFSPFFPPNFPNKNPSKWHISRHPRWHLDVHISNKPPIEQPTHFAVWQWGRFTWLWTTWTCCFFWEEKKGRLPWHKMLSFSYCAIRVQYRVKFRKCYVISNLNCFFSKILSLWSCIVQELLDSSNSLAPLIPTWIIFGSSILVPTFRPNIPLQQSKIT